MGQRVRGKGIRVSLVFVHGVANRPNARLEAGKALRDRLFRRFLLARMCKDPDTTRILNPCWGEHAARLRWNHASLPREEGEALGAGNLDDLALVVSAQARLTGEDGASLVLATARRSLSDAVDLLFTAADTEGSEDLDETAQLASRLVGYCRGREQLMPSAPEEERHRWLPQVVDDAGLVARLCEEAAPWSLSPSGEPLFDQGLGKIESFGSTGTGRGVLINAVNRLRRAVVHRASTPVISLLRAVVAEATSMFIGDVFTYLAKRGSREDPGPIVRVVAGAIEDAQHDRRDHDPVIVVAHSMGGNIVYDVLTFYRPELGVDLLITVGSQVGFFEELKLFNSSEADVPYPARPKAAAPGVGRWINVFDRADPLSYRAEPIFEIVTDYAYPTGAWWAHSGYFCQPNFHDRLARRAAGGQR